MLTLAFRSLPHEAVERARGGAGARVLPFHAGAGGALLPFGVVLLEELIEERVQELFLVVIRVLVREQLLEPLEFFLYCLGQPRLFLRKLEPDPFRLLEQAFFRLAGGYPASH